ncbi:bifunctional serine/threonine-protein kinase/formylglycine-generating enzyme family protein [Massilia pinisoli]|uniref:Bifunctional serine/threonine-protein kinase/formylglycine-generating enzyme family protein n=2 Tax=Massilia pinisoli TaxID=1772194 RepID=A0ABT1ZWL8_9BURK|nr:bifunctional serine/threonine-protein kinase/formylglycine-generating enzyme family protein [Massilia pinisoli]
MHTAIDKLRELRALHEDGLLSRQEFDSRKNAILDVAYPADAPVDTATPARAGTEIGLMATQEVGPAHRRYRLERLIAQGGMGEVWQATDLATHAELGHSAQVALKILPPRFTENALHAKLLIEEAARARQLAHQHIVRVYDWAQDPATGSYFIIMECLDGEDLDTVLAREGPLELGRALAVLTPVASALDYAWERHGLVHRDIKPANVFVARGGDVKLLDFGIAARARAGGAALEAPATSGTAGYRAPEAGGGAPTRGLDVYAVAVMLYRMLTGALPDAAPARPDALNAAQWGVLRAGFAARPDDRPASVTELLSRLRAAQGPSADEMRAQAEAAQRAEADAARARAEQATRDAQARKVAQAQAEQRARLDAAAKAELERQRREQERAAKAEAEAARAARKEALRRQLLERRAAEVEKARLEREEEQRKVAQAKAAAAYIAEQKRARQEQAARAQAELTQLMPTPASPVADTDGVLRDRFGDAGQKGPELVLLPTGRFQMGSPEHERKIAMAAGSQPAWLARELPQHWVGIEKPIAMGRYPVTVGEWRLFVAATGWRSSGEVDWDAPGFAQTDRHPVVGVNWFDAIRYVRWLSEVTGKSYRLPSEAEWEYACRAGTKTAFSFGDTIAPDQANYDGNFTYNGGPRGEYRRGTTPVGAFAANPWGLFDMHGNVWEWVQDVVHDNYDGAPLDGSAWEDGGDQARRVLRGGSWLYTPRYLRSALRNGFSAALSNDIVGFRVVRDLM